MGSNIESILERQARLWEVGRRLVEQDQAGARRELLHHHRGPWITISRQEGAAGGALAERIAAALEWQVFDQQILQSIAEQRHSRAAVFARLDERAIGGFNDYLSQLLMPGHPGQAAYLQEMMRIVWGLAEQGKAVILGRGANWFLDPRYGLRVRVVAPLERRVARLAELRRVAPEEAERIARQADGDQRAFVRQVFGREIDDPTGYDLVLNMGGLRLEDAAEVLLATLRRKLV